MDCVFCKIVGGEIPSELVHQDEHVVVFPDLHPQAPTHLLVVPRRHVASLFELDDPALGGALLAAARRVAEQAGLERGWRLIANTREHGGQEIDHLHLHVLGGRSLGPMLSRAGR